MKKIFCVAGIAAFSFASAQNTTDTFWVKPLTTVPGINTFQLPKTHPFDNTPRLRNLSPLDRQALDRAKFLNALTNGDKVYALPQDNRPCVVPDQSQYNMPVVKPDVVHTIPNPGYRSQLKGKPDRDRYDKFFNAYPYIWRYMKQKREESIIRTALNMTTQANDMYASPPYASPDGLPFSLLRSILGKKAAQDKSLSSLSRPFKDLYRKAPWELSFKKLNPPDKANSFIVFN